MQRTKRFLLLLALFYWLTGCATAAPSQVEQPSGAASPTPAAVGPKTASPIVQGQTPTAVPGGGGQPSASPTPTPAITLSNGKLTVTLNTNTDVEVNASSFKVTGQAPDGTVISCNDQISVVGKSQRFDFTVPLDQGPNLIELVASDIIGDEVNFEITVTNTAQ